MSFKTHRVEDLMHVKSAKAQSSSKAWFGTGCELGCRPRHLPVVQNSKLIRVAAVAEWYRYRTVACFVTGLAQGHRYHRINDTETQAVGAPKRGDPARSKPPTNLTHSAQEHPPATMKQSAGLERQHHWSEAQ
ncbi:hypothetical protein TNCV_4061561 [Trichonephila clavipes]|nr:hypothetical protein TNCV_4061561 [Trichonephila clavipes]